MSQEEMIMNQDTQKSHFINALDLMIMSVYKPDSELRTEAMDLGCLEELMQIRENVLEYLQEMRQEQI
jgi:hypothetical protein